MSGSYWKQVMERGLEVPEDRPLPDLTAELTTMLGSADPALRDGLAYPALGTWIDRGVYDDLLVGLGDGMSAGLAVGLGESGTDTVFRRSFSALVLATVIERDSAQHLLPGDQVLRWGDRIVSWFVRERDVRGFVPGKGWAHAVAHGADAIGSLAGSRHFGPPELTVLLDVLADRVLLDPGSLAAGEPDRIALAVLAVLRRNVVPTAVFEPWVARVAAGANPFSPRAESNPYPATDTAQQLLRSLYLLLSLAPDPPADKADQILAMVDALRETNPFALRR